MGEGVNAYRFGQLNEMGRYPFHFHMMGDVNKKSFFRYNAVHNSYFRAFTIHATSNSTVSHNVAFDIEGSAYYLEDGVEEDNQITHNLAAHIHIIEPLID